MAFKGESDDNRDSLSYKLKKLLEVEAKEVLCTDPYVADRDWFRSRKPLQSGADIIVLGAPHAAYRDLQIPDKDCGRYLELLAGAPADLCQPRPQPWRQERRGHENTGHWLGRIHLRLSGRGTAPGRV